MKISEVARQAGVTVKAVRYYESLGLLSASRRANGYRDFDDAHVTLVREIRALGRLGIPADETRPFLDCLVSGRERGDDCAESVQAYRAAITETDARIAELTQRRARLAALHSEASQRAEPLCAFSAAAYDPALVQH